jgi:hypothetical protein
VRTLPDYQITDVDIRRCRIEWTLLWLPWFTMTRSNGFRPINFRHLNSCIVWHEFRLQTLSEHAGRGGSIGLEALPLWIKCKMSLFDGRACYFPTWTFSNFSVHGVKSKFNSRHHRKWLCNNEHKPCRVRSLMKWWVKRFVSNQSQSPHSVVLHIWLTDFRCFAVPEICFPSSPGRCGQYFGRSSTGASSSTPSGNDKCW